MNYSQHKDSAIFLFPELDLVKEDEFHLFKNEKFATQCINLCIDLCNNVSKKLKINLNLGIKYDHTFNAKALVKNKQGVIVLNLGLIENLESIVSNSIEIFSKENISKLTISDAESEEMKILFADLCFSYIFYHELAHILQMFNISPEGNYNFQEKYSEINNFNIKNHIYEFDADLFGISMSTIKLFVYLNNKSYPINPILFFNSLTALLFSFTNIVILFSNNQFNSIYFKNNSHPHPIIRIIKCNNQILSLTSINYKIREEILLAILQRTISMIDQINYNDNGQINYSNLMNENLLEIEKYINEIEIINESYSELIRFKSQEIFNCLNNY